MVSRAKTRRVPRNCRRSSRNYLKIQLPAGTYFWRIPASRSFRVRGSQPPRVRLTMRAHARDPHRHVSAVSARCQSPINVILSSQFTSELRGSICQTRREIPVTRNWSIRFRCSISNARSEFLRACYPCPSICEIDRDELSIFKQFWTQVTVTVSNSSVIKVFFVISRQSFV